MRMGELHAPGRVCAGRHTRTVLACLLAGWGAGPSRAAQAGVALPQHVVKQVLDDRRIVLFDCRPDDRVELNETVVFFKDGKTVSTGRIFVRDETHFGVKLEASAGVPTVGQSATRITRDVAAAMRAWLPTETTLWTRLDRRSPSAAAAWIAGGQQEGFRVGDRLFVLRSDIPIARMELSHVYERAALGSLVALVSNAAVEPGDACRLWPGPTDPDVEQSATRVVFVKAAAGADQ